MSLHLHLHIWSWQSHFELNVHVYRVARTDLALYYSGVVWYLFVSVCKIAPSNHSLTRFVPNGVTGVCWCIHTGWWKGIHPDGHWHWWTLIDGHTNHSPNRRFKSLTVNAHVFELGRKTWQKEPLAHIWRTCKLHRKRVWLGCEPVTFWMWVHTNHWAKAEAVWAKLHKTIKLRLMGNSFAVWS